MLPISSSLFRANGSSPNFHKSVLSVSCTLESSKHPSSCLPRRLVCSKSKQTNVDGRSREDAQSSNKSRFHSKFGKVKFNPNTDNNLHRSNVLFKRGNSSSYFRTNNQTSVRNRKYLKNGKSRDCLHLLVIMASYIELIPNARLFMRPIQLHLLFHWKPSSQILEAKVPFSKLLKSHLKWWLNQENLNKGRSITP